MSEPLFKIDDLIKGIFINDFGDVIFEKIGKVTQIWHKISGNSNGGDVFLYSIDDCESIFPEYLVQIAPLEIKTIKTACPTCGKL